MEDQVINFIRDRFNSLEQTVCEGFEKVDCRLCDLEDDKLTRNTKQGVYGLVGGGLVSFVGWLAILIFGK